MIRLPEEFTQRKILNTGKVFQDYKIVDHASYYNGLEPS